MVKREKEKLLFTCYSKHSLLYLLTLLCAARSVDLAIVLVTCVLSLLIMVYLYTAAMWA